MRWFIINIGIVIACSLLDFDPIPASLSFITSMSASSSSPSAHRKISITTGIFSLVIRFYFFGFYSTLGAGPCLTIIDLFFS